jgi:tripartite-type tricarboxylate transporter receptor subunit TctC
MKNALRQVSTSRQRSGPRGTVRRLTIKHPRRQLLSLAAGAIALPAVSRIAWAQVYPTRPITIIVPFAAGGPSDVAARLAGQQMSRILGQQLIVENLPGAGGTIGSTRAMRANPDGYTVLMGHMGTHATAVSLYPTLPYKPEVDFEPIGMVVEVPAVVIARRDFPAKTLSEFAAYLKANGEKVNMAHAGVGSNTFVECLLLNSIVGVKPTMVPFNGTTPIVNALLGGQVDYSIAGVSDIGQQVQSGTLKAYAIASEQRNPVLPSIPTSAEAGLPDFKVSAWFAMFAPRRTPQSVLDRLSGALDKALADQDLHRRLAELGLDAPSKEKRGQDALATLVKSEIARWTPIIRAANVKLE